MKTGIERLPNTYFNLHQKLARKFGKASSCQNAACTSVSPKRFEWALIKGREYSSDSKDYLQLCPSCHRKYDYKQSTGENHSRRMKGLIPSLHQLRSLSAGRALSMKTVLQFDRHGNFIREWAILNLYYSYHCLVSLFECSG